MRRIVSFVVIALIVLTGPGLWAQGSGQSAPASNEDTVQLRQEIEQLKKTVAAMEQRLDAAQKSDPGNAATSPENKQTVSVPDLQKQIDDLNTRADQAERKSALDRLNWSGDFRVESNSIFGHVPTHYDGMQLQSLVTKTMWMVAPTSQGGLGMPSDPATMQQLMQSMTPAQYAAYVNGKVSGNYSQYQYFSNNLTFNQLKASMAQFAPQMQQALMGYLQQAPGVLVPGYPADTNVLMTNRLRLNFNARVADNVNVEARLSMYKVFGDSTNVQVFNGQPNTLNLDGTTARVPTGDFVRVERAFFTWSKMAGLPMYISIGRRPSTDGPPLHFREDELRGGTPPGSLFNYQYDGVTVGYHLAEKTTLRVCYGMGYTAGFGNGTSLLPDNQLKDVHLLGVMADLYETDHTFVQAIMAHAWNVTDGFNGLMVLPNNPITGDPITAPVVMRYTPSANLGSISLYGLTMQKRLGQFDTFLSTNWDSLRPNGITTPFGGMGSDPFETPTNHDGYMIYAGVRYSIPQDDGRTKLGFEFNHGSKYWFNFAQAEDDILAPKTSVRGEAYETYLTHRINDHFILKADYQRLNYAWSGSGWDLGAPKSLSTPQVLGFPTYNMANLFTVGLTARF